MTEGSCPSRVLLAGIQAGFVSDGYLPQTRRYDKGEMNTRYQPAGMTKPKEIFTPDL
jgi:hypothetical protein